MQCPSRMPGDPSVVEGRVSRCHGTAVLAKQITLVKERAEQLLPSTKSVPARPVQD